MKQNEGEMGFHSAAIDGSRTPECSTWNTTPWSFYVSCSWVGQDGGLWSGDQLVEKLNQSESE
jgi:hypothetical protein